MSLEEHHRFILNAMDRQTDIARKLIEELEARNAALAAENERLTRLLLDLSNAVHIHRANANGSKCDAEINRIVAEVDTIFDIQ